MEYDVTIDRDKYIGGSDIPVIMGLSPFKKRWDLLLEKAGLKDNEFSGNKYTEYGNIMEPKIREYINVLEKAYFKPNQVIDGIFRGHTDGYDNGIVLEIKTTSQIYECVDEYLLYLVQLVKYMSLNNAAFGILAVYERPEDFSTEFDKKRLHIYWIAQKQYENLLKTISNEIDRFCEDLERLKGNPLLTEEDFQPNELVTISNKVIELENQMKEFKTLEAQHEEMKQQLFEAMQKYDVKSWEMFNGTKITRVDEVPEKSLIKTVFNEDLFRSEQEELYNKYLVDKKKKISGKKGYVRITYKE